MSFPSPLGSIEADLGDLDMMDNPSMPAIWPSSNMSTPYSSEATHFTVEQGPADINPHDTEITYAPPVPHINQPSWDYIKAPFIQLYEGKGMKLKDVMMIMERDHNFNAPSEHAYKKKITAWGIGKYFTKQEKKNFAVMAKRLIACGQQLPEYDDLGRQIPWDRVRRQEGKDAVPRIRSRLMSSRIEAERQRSIGPLPQARYRSIECVSAFRDKNDGLEMGNTTSSFNNWLSMTRCVTIPSISPPLALPDHLRLSNSMFHHLKDCYTWLRNERPRPADSGSEVRLRDVYYNVHHQVRLCSQKERARILSSAAKQVSPSLEQLNATTLQDLLLAIYDCSEALNRTYFAATLKFFVDASQQVFGQDRPVTLLLETLLEAVDVRRSTKGKVALVCDGASDVPLVELMRYYNTQLTTSNTNSELDMATIFDAQHNLVNILIGEKGNLSQAESLCRDLVAWSAQRFGAAHHRSLAAQLLVDHVLLDQDRLTEAHSLITKLWTLWTEEHRKIDIAGLLAQEIDWCPAWDMMRVCRRQGDIHGAIYFSREAFLWSLLRNGQTTGGTLDSLDWHVYFLETTGNYEAIEELKRAYPVPCSMLRRLRVDEEEEEEDEEEGEIEEEIV
ncbi:hypothetical protein LTR64_007755 [Lithohypha guttulata]|uniref:uncharacterized protein n=1 Tax=Lithohypha guttulata TaxID=1690604 RepID=UPI002DDFDEB1|nr:hypothetical protein LTR51_007265 [Lithohypha guttulata]